MSREKETAPEEGRRRKVVHEMADITTREYQLLKRAAEEVEIMVGKKETARPRGTDSARVIQVIETKALCGAGTEEDPCRWLTQYWSLEGELLAERDPHYLGRTDNAASNVNSESM